ncbi:uncharacterized protein LOC132744494 isoform X2 [Ruditapes philippinarum]|uniref:uncharacterized protein LOC132744494 isoform X2 n=1 Tax=Ruditapes philippinarum TaxID=129788 RepID=UPI00295AFF85|nr:uncharacterized protein LOC132744494 isoform X2 [Ruditapes philippinarum]
MPTFCLYNQCTFKSPNKPLQTQLKPDFDLQKQQPKGDAKDLTDGNVQKYHDWFVIPSMVRPDTSNKAQSNREKWKKGNLAENNSMNDSGHREQKDVKQLQQSLTECGRELEKEKADRRKAIERFNDLKEQFNKLQTDKNELQMRLSKIAGDKLRDNNPAIADLSDPNRPTKIGEMYSEVYDNEWTDAFEALNDAGYDEREAVDTLRLTLLNIIQFCSKKSESLLERTEEAVNILFEEYKATQQMKIKRHLTMPKKASERWGKLVRGQTFDLDDISLQNKWKPKDQSDAKKNKLHKTIVEPNTSGEVIANQLKKFRKEVSVSMVPLVEKAYISASWNEECINDLKPFIRKCLLIGWMMVVQSPPMTLEDLKPNEEFRKEIYKSYTKSGSYIDYVVWPALLLNQDGPVVGKGVAQGKKNN